MSDCRMCKRLARFEKLHGKVIVCEFCQVENLKAENKKLRECVEFYADKDNWNLDQYDIQDRFDPDWGKYGDPGFTRAAKCLEELGEEK